MNKATTSANAGQIQRRPDGVFGLFVDANYLSFRLRQVIL